MFISPDPMITGQILLLGFLGWIAKGAKKLLGGAKKPDRESIREGISRATESSKASRTHAGESRKAAERTAKSAPLIAKRVTKRQMARNTESRGAYRRRTGR